MTESDLKDINRARKSVGLAPLEPGETTCLRCQKTFWSWAKAYNRICPSCGKVTKLPEDASPVDVSDICPDVQVANHLTEIELWRTTPRSRNQKEIYRHGRHIVDLDEDHLHLYDPEHENEYISDEETEEDLCQALQEWDTRNIQD